LDGRTGRDQTNVKSPARIPRTYRLDEILSFEVMIKDQNQEAGDNSTNLQGKTIVINQGISYSDAKAIALDVFKANALELSTRAADIARGRAEELIDGFLEELRTRAPESINKMEDPGMQYAIFTAQKEYAKTGDKDLAKLLVDILVDLAKQEGRDLKQIVLDESLSTVTKLTAAQLDTLTVIFISKYTVNHNVVSIKALSDYLNAYFLPFIKSLSREHSLYQHLEFAGCGSISLGASPLEEIFKGNYTGIFQKGLPKEEIEKQLDKPMASMAGLFITSLRDNSLYQINAINNDSLENQAIKSDVTGVALHKLKALFTSQTFSAQEVKDDLINHCPDFKLLFEIWTDSSLKHMTMTSVGIALAQTNLRVKAGITVDLGIWIK
jgi:hypothetical protein